MVQLQFIVHGKVPQFLDVEGSHPSTAGNEDGFCGLAGSQLVKLISSLFVTSDGTTARIEKIYEDILDGICDAVDQKVERLRNRYKYTDKATFRFFNDFAKGVKGILDMFPVIFCAGHGNSPFPPKRVVHD